MKCWNKKKKIKHWTKPKWKTRASETSRIRNYYLTTRGIKDKYKFMDFFFNYTNNKPKYEILGKSLEATQNEKRIKNH